MCVSVPDALLKKIHYPEVTCVGNYQTHKINKLLRVMLHMVPSFPAFFKENLQLNLNHETVMLDKAKYPKTVYLRNVLWVFAKILWAAYSLKYQTFLWWHSSSRSFFIAQMTWLRKENMFCLTVTHCQSPLFSYQLYFQNKCRYAEMVVPGEAGVEDGVGLMTWSWTGRDLCDIQRLLYFIWKG